MAEIKQDNEFILSVLIDTIKGDKKHKWYDRTVSKAHQYNILTTGEHSEELLKRFVRRESEELFKQRVEITQEIHSSVVKQLTDINYKIPRSPGITLLYEYKDSEEKQKEFNDILAQFYGDVSWTDFVNSRFIQLQNTDPNAFIVIEFTPTDGTTRTQPYPFEVSSKEAVNFEYINNILQWLIVKNDVEYLENPDDTASKKKGFKYTIYGKNNAIKIESVSTQGIPIPPNVQEFTTFEYEDKLYLKVKNGIMLITVAMGYETGEVVPAFRIGFIGDEYTKNATFLPTYGAAIPILMKTIKTVSELDLTSSLHAFPQKISYQSACKTCDGAKEVEFEGGMIACKACAGTGTMTHTSSQDEITLKLPAQPVPDELADLSKLIYYVPVPVDIIEWQNKYINELVAECKQVIFNSAVWNKEDVNKTATGVNVNAENVYDALYPLAVKYKNTWSFGIEIMSKATNLNEGLTIISHVAEDLKLKTKDDYLNDLKLAKEAGASQSILRNIENEILRIDHRENKLQFNKYLTQDYFYPYSGKDKDQVAVIISSLPLTDKNKVLWMEYGNIYETIELSEGMDFYLMDRNKQKDIIDKAVALRIDEIKLETETQTFESDINN